MTIYKLYRNKYFIQHHTPSRFRKNKTAIKTKSVKQDIVFEENISHPDFDSDKDVQDLDCVFSIDLYGVVRIG